MAKKSDYTRFSVYSKKDPDSGDYNIPSYERDIRNIINNAVKSALPEGAFFQVGEKELTKTGRARWDIFVHTENKAVADKSLGTIEQELTFRGGGQKYDITRARPVTAEQAKALFREESAKQNTEESRKLFGAVTKITGLLTSLIVITRRILSSVLSYAVQTNQDMITAHNLGMSYEAVRAYRHTELTHSLKEGTITGAVSDIQSKFGNITALDENALSALAVVMGGEIKEAIDMGLGTSNPEKVLGLILDKFNERANAGYNSVGQYVGEQQARRELYSYLLKVSPQIADIFATMQEEQHNINSLFRGQADTFENWKNAVPTSRGNTQPPERNVVATTGQEWNIVKEIARQIKEGIEVSLAPDVLALLRRISDLRIGMSERENRQRDEENRQANADFLDSARSQLTLLQGDNLTQAEKQRKLALEYFIEKVEKANEGGIDGHIHNAVPTSDEIVVRGQRLYDKQIEEDVINYNFSGGEEALRKIISIYVTPEEQKAFADKYYDKQVASVQERGNEAVNKERKKRQDEANVKFNEALSKAKEKTKDKDSEYYFPAFGKFRGLDEITLRNMAQVEELYGDDMKAKGLWDIWKSTPPMERKSLALGWGYTYLDSANFQQVKRVEPTPITLKEEAQIRKPIQESFEYDEDAMFKAMYKFYEGRLIGHLIGELQDEARERATEGTPLYDLDVLQREYGYNLAGLSTKLPSSTYSGEGKIRSYTTSDNDVIVHKIVFDLYNDDKLVARDIPLSEYTTNRISDTGAVDTVQIKNGRITATGSSASEQAGEQYGKD